MREPGNHDYEASDVLALTAYCIKCLPEKNSDYFNQSFLAMVKSMVNLCLPEFQILPVFSPVKVLCNGVFCHSTAKVIECRNLFNACERSLRLHHVLFLERVMVALKRAHSCSGATITLSRKNTWCNRKPLSHVSSPWKPSKTTCTLFNALVFYFEIACWSLLLL